jgi:hypothetical protein
MGVGDSKEVGKKPMERKEMDDVMQHEVII